MLCRTEEKQSKKEECRCSTVTKILNFLTSFTHFFFNVLQSNCHCPTEASQFTDLVNYKVYHDGSRETTNIIVRLLKHVSAAPLSILSARGILRGTVQSVALYFVHGCSVSLPRSPEGEAGGPLTICCCHWGWHHHVRSAMPAPASPRPGSDPLCLSSTALRPTVFPHRVIYGCLTHTGCWSRGIRTTKLRDKMFFLFVSDLPLSSFYSWKSHSKSHIWGCNLSLRRDSKADTSSHAAVSSLTEELLSDPRD